MTTTTSELVLFFDEARAKDINRVGGKNASLAEMTQTLVPRGIRVPPGYAVTATAYWRFVDASSLRGPITALLADWKAERKTLHEAGHAIRNLLRTAPIPDDVRAAITTSYQTLVTRCGGGKLSVAVRSSATAGSSPPLRRARSR